MVPATVTLPASAVTLTAEAASSAWPAVSLPMKMSVLAAFDGPTSVLNSKLRLAMKPPVLRAAFTSANALAPRRDWRPAVLKPACRRSR